jgi:hypothetical protein
MHETLRKGKQAKAWPVPGIKGYNARIPEFGSFAPAAV